MKRECGKCKGDGYYHDGPVNAARILLCGVCDATGLVEVADDHDNCQACEGTGIVATGPGSGDAAPCVQCVPAAFTISDSGEREQHPTGAVRDTQDGKPRYSLVPPEALARVAMHFTAGAAKYDDDNWRKGMSFRRTLDSLMRHVEAWRAGDRVEDHLAAVAVNAMFLMTYETLIAAGTLPATLNDMP